MEDAVLRKFVYWSTIYSLLISLIPAPIASAAPIPIISPSALPIDYSLFIAPPDAQPLLQLIPENLDTLYNIPAELQAPVGPYRTTVRVRGSADLARLRAMGVTILSSSRTDAMVIADRLQLEQLAKQSFFPRNTELTANLKTATRAPLAPSATTAQLAAAVASDIDSDGLSDTEESWWCTDPNNADSNNDKVSDGASVQGLLDWLQHKTTTRPASGKPFAGWPPDHAGCYDSDYDSVPDAVEVFVLGLNPNLESTAHDKFDDGQKLFGITNCPGSGGGCGYGALPRAVDWGVIFSQMPSWVKPPYDSPFVAAFPEPDVEVIPSSFVVTAKTTVTTDHTISNGEANTYGTAETHGSSDSRADTTTWNTWNEVSLSVPVNPSARPQRLFAPNEQQSDAGKLTDVALGVGGCWGLDKWKKLITVSGGLSRIFTLGSCLKFIKDNLHYVTDYFNPPAVYSNGFGDDPPIQNFQKDENSCQPLQDQQYLASPSRLNPRAVASGDYCGISGIHSPTSNEYLQFQGTSLANGQQNSGSGGESYVYTGGQVRIQRVIPMVVPVAQVPPVLTDTTGESHGGALTLTHTEYEEHTVSQSSTKQFSQSWSNATAIDTVHTADLNFTYRISNKGTDYAREIGNIAFNIFIGDDPNPIYTYFPAADIGSTGTFINFMPGETHIYASRAVPLTLNQMKAIDTGSHIFIVVEDFSYGVDELFYQDAINSGATLHIDSGSGILSSYVLPTWGTESIQDVVRRFLPSTIDPDNNLLSLSVPDYSTQTPTWQVHALADNAWWDMYLNNLGDGSLPFKDTVAVANSSILIRMNSDTDRDGYNDRTEISLGTNPNDAASHPTPSLTAAKHSVQVGNTVTVTMSFLNSGNYDAYGVEAVMYAPDSSVTITNNTIGGGGRVKTASQVVLGSRIMPVSLTNWHGGAKPYSAGSYTGNMDKTFTFTAANPGNIGNGTVNVNWNDGVGNSGTMNLGSGYQAPLPLAIANGLQIGFDTGSVNAGDMFTVSARLPRDTFSFTDNTGNGTYTSPVVVVSYNDPQGNHKFVSSLEVGDLGTNLTPYASQMLQGVGVDIATTAAFNSSGNNTVYLIANSPHSQSIVNGHLFLEFVNITGTVVSQQVFTQTLQTGPNDLPVILSGTSFPGFPTSDYTLLTFLTDSQGNIIDSHARLFSTFAADPTPILNTSPASWNIGSVTQGDQKQQVISVVNTGLLPLNVVIGSTNPALTLSGASGIISVPPASTKPVTATLDTTMLSGSIAISLTVRSNDPAHQTVAVPVVGTVTGAVGQASAFDITNRPLDKSVRVYVTGSPLPQFSAVDFTHGLQPDTVSIQPCRVLDSTGTTLKGVGRYCADFNSGTASAQVFGSGADGPLSVTGIQMVNNTRSALSATSSAGQLTLSVSSTSGFAVNQEILIHQTQGTGAGNYEFGKIASIGSGTMSLQGNLVNTYTQGGNSHAQVINVPNFTDVTVQNGGTLTAPAWDGSTGGILVFRANGTTTVIGAINASAIGYRGGNGGTGGWSAPQAEGTNGPGGTISTSANGNGGGGGCCADPNGAGGGGGNASAGLVANNGYGNAQGGYPSGNVNLTNATFGGGGGGGSDGSGSPGGGAGGRGGGIVLLYSKTTTISGSVSLAGGNGGNAQAAPLHASGGGGGAGGSFLLRSQNATIGNNAITAPGGSGGSGDANVYGGSGSVGRIRIEYQNVTGSIVTSPAASTQQVTFYLAEGFNYVSFGTGADGPLSVSGTQIINTTRTALTANSSAGQINLSVASTSGFGVGNEILVHQTQGIGAGNYEFVKIESIGSGTLGLQGNLVNTYTQGGNSHAQVIRVPQYTDVTVPNGTTLTAPSWDGSTGGILVFRANGTTSVNGTIRVDGTNGASYTADNITGGAVGGGFRGGNMNNVANVGNESQRQAYTGEGHTGPSIQSGSNNGSGGAGGLNNADFDAGGGGHAMAGQSSVGSGGHAGGVAVGDSNLTTLFFGGGGGGGSNDSGPAGVTAGSGGSGGGIIFVNSKSLSVSGGITANGGNGGNSNENGGGGGGAGGSVFLRGQSVTIGTNIISAAGGHGGTTASSDRGGDGSVGRIRFEYCDSLSGATSNPVATSQRLNCFIADSTDPSTIHFTLPDQVNSPGLNYVFQFGRRLAFSSAGNLSTFTRVVSQTYSSATMEALVTNVGAGGSTNVQIQMGSTPIYSQTQSITQPTTINIPNFAAALNQYIIAQPNASTIDIPTRVTIDRQADVILTNLGVTPGSGIDLVTGGGALTFACSGGVSCLTNPPRESDIITPTVTIRNLGNQTANSAVVGYYVGDPNNGGRLLGNSYVATISPGGTVTATLPWDTTGYTHTQTIYALVDPPNAIAETLENNNVVSQTLYIRTKPDLRVSSIGLSSTDRVVGEPITATIVLSNTGETLAPSHYTGFIASGGGFSDSQNMPTASIAPTGTLTMTRAFTPTVFGSYLITITADATSAITESLESNNVLTRTVFVGLNKQVLDSGNGSESAYSALNGYGFLNGSTYDFGGGTLTKTVRYDGSGQVQYQFDGLQATRSYHLDSTYYQEGDTFTQTVSFDGISSGPQSALSLVDSQPSVASMLVPSAAYADRSMIVSILRPNGGLFRPTRFREGPSIIAPAFVSELTLTPIDYWYVDAGNASDLAYSAVRGYGYLNGFASGSGDAVGTYRSAFTSTVFYQFDNLNPNKRYTVDLTMYDAAGTTRQQSITSNGATVCGPFTLNATIMTQCAITPTVAGRVVIGVQRTNGTGPIVNEIAVEEKTRDTVSPLVPPTITPTFTWTPTATPTNTIQTIVSAFSAQWNGNLVQVNWSTTKEYKTDRFDLYRSNTISPAAWTLVKTQVPNSNCLLQTTPFAYGYTDNNVVSGQTYYYRLQWSGDTCGALAPASPLYLDTNTNPKIYLPLIEKGGGGAAPDRVTTPTVTPSPSPLPTSSSTRTPAATLTRPPLAPATTAITPTSAQTKRLPPITPTLTLTPTLAPNLTFTPTRK